MLTIITARRLCLVLCTFAIILFAGGWCQPVSTHPAPSTGAGAGVWGGVCGNPPIRRGSNRWANSGTHDERQAARETKSKSKSKKQTRKDRQERDAIIGRLAREFIHVRLNIVYDKALEERHRDHPGGVQAFIRDFVYTLQLTYEQPELSSLMKINFVVVSIKRSSLNFPGSDPALVMMRRFENSSEAEEDPKLADINCLLVYRSLGRLYNEDIETDKHVLGLGALGAFCSDSSKRAIMLQAESLGAYPVFAHEMAHALNVQHDGEPGTFSGHCSSKGGHLMSSSVGPNYLTWSTCSVTAMLEHFVEKAKCIYDPQRVASARPLSDSFDLNPSSAAGQANRRSLPGELVPLDEQCARGVARRATAASVARQSESRYTVCQSLICELGQSFSLSIGPAVQGSACTNISSSETGRCSRGKCLN